MVGTWIFFYEDKNGERIATGIKKCIAPDRTKRHKKNLKRLQDNETLCVGYERI